MKKTVLSSYQEVRKYRASVIKEAQKAAGGKGAERLFRNPLAPLAFFVGILFLIASFFAGEAQFAVLCGGVSMILFSMLCMATEPSTAFLLSFLIFSCYPALQILWESFRSGTEIPQDDRIFLAQYLPMIGALAALAVLAILLKAKLRGQTVYTPFPENGGGYFADMTLADIDHVEGYPTYAHLHVDITHPVRFSRLNGERSAFTRFARSRKILMPAVRMHVEEPQSMDFYLYLPEGVTEQDLRTYAEGRFQKFETESEPDISWEIFRSRILPDDKTVFRLYNRQLSQYLARTQFQTVPMEYIVGVEDPTQAEACAECVKNADFYLRPAGKKILRTDHPDGMLYFVAESTVRTGNETLNAVSDRLIDLVSPFGGKLLRCGVIKKKFSKNT